VIKRILRPKTVLPMGFALGLVVLWELGALPVPVAPDAGPIARAALAVGIAVVGAFAGFALQLLLAKLFGGAAGPPPGDG
jgi:hypothetical protein